MIFFSLKGNRIVRIYAPLSSPLPHPQPPCSDLGILHGHPTPDSRPPVHASHEISEPGESRGPRARANDTARENIRESSAKKNAKKDRALFQKKKNCAETGRSRVRVIPHYTSMAFCCQLTQIPRISPLKSLGGLDAYGPRWESRGRRPHEADASRSRWRVGDAPKQRERAGIRFLSLSSKGGDLTNEEGRVPP